jgi:hypothetical protein
MENERMWEGPFEPGDPNGPALTNRAYQSNTVNLYTDGKEICAMIGPRPGTGYFRLWCVSARGAAGPGRQSGQVWGLD